MFFKELFSKWNLIGNGLILLLVGIFVIWAETSPISLARLTVEDGLIESLTAFLFAVACIGFIMTLKKSEHLKTSSGWWRYVFLAGWIFVMFVFCGEEISWGQRFLGFDTPDAIEKVNVQREFNLHNFAALQTIKYRMLSLLMFITGVLLPGIVLFGWGKKFMQKISMPVLPLCYSGFFVFSYLYGSYYYDALPIDAATEVRELLMGLGMAAFGLHGALRSDDLFRFKRT
ncbi:MAG: hypothetical protein KAU36_09410 [candidate division Zixibacteria bacterium]|nr:hypothetical protein [candidate division Zixibacteria bacterium]